MQVKGNYELIKMNGFAIVARCKKCGNISSICNHKWADEKHDWSKCHCAKLRNLNEAEIRELEHELRDIDPVTGRKKAGLETEVKTGTSKFRYSNAPRDLW